VLKKSAAVWHKLCPSAAGHDYLWNGKTLLCPCPLNHLFVHKGAMILHKSFADDLFQLKRYSCLTIYLQCGLCFAVNLEEQRWPGRQEDKMPKVNSLQNCILAKHLI
jgi:hypothetical protein